MKRTFIVLGLSAMLAMPVLAVGQQTTPGTSGGMGSGGSGMGTRMEQQRGQAGQQGQRGQQAMDQEQIREAQQQLKEAGFDPGPIDGIFGERTKSALREFQQAHGLPQTGQLDQATRQELMAQSSPMTPGRPQPSREPSLGSPTPGGAMPGGPASGQPSPGPGTPSGPGSGR